MQVLFSFEWLSQPAYDKFSDFRWLLPMFAFFLPPLPSFLPFHFLLCVFMKIRKVFYFFIFLFTRICFSFCTWVV